MRTYFVYLLASKPRGTLYIGVTNTIIDRVAQHRVGKGSVFTRRYNVHRLVWFQEYGDIREATSRRAAPWILGTSPGMTSADAAQTPIPLPDA